MGACSILFVLLRMLCQQKLCFCARLLPRAWLSHLPGTMQDDDAAFGDSFAAAFHRQLSLASPLQGGSSSDRRASLATPGQRRLSAVQQPESHPVSPAARDRGGAAPVARRPYARYEHRSRSALDGVDASRGDTALLASGLRVHYPLQPLPTPTPPIAILRLPP